jgi:hypothetical protein
MSTPTQKELVNHHSKIWFKYNPQTFELQVQVSPRPLSYKSKSLTTELSWPLGYKSKSLPDLWVTSPSLSQTFELQVQVSNHWAIMTFGLQVQVSPRPFSYKSKSLTTELSCLLQLRKNLSTITPKYDLSIIPRPLSYKSKSLPDLWVTSPSL